MLRQPHLVLNIPPRTPTLPLLQQLHCLPIEARISYKLCSLMHKVTTELCHYISSNSVNLAQTCVYVLRHAATINCHVPRTNRRFTISSFSISAPTVWIIVCLTISVAHLLSLFPNQAQDPPFQYLIFSPSACNLISFYNNYCVFLFLICCNKRPRALVVGRYSKFLRFDLI